MAQPSPSLKRRVQLFGSLRAAQRALARCIHPSQLAEVRGKGRDLLIKLQALSSLSESQKSGDPAAEDFDTQFEEALDEVDRLLEEQTRDTLVVVGSLEFDHLRSSGRRLCLSFPEEVGALIDVMLQADLDEDNTLRLIEYLVTIRSTDEWNGRRTVVREPSDLTPGLREFARAAVDNEEIIPNAAEKTFADASASMVHGGDLHDTRNQIRDYKKELGRHVFHPRILSSVVAYNVAMWNQVAAQIDSTLGVDQLADELLADYSDSSEDTGDEESRDEYPPSLIFDAEGFGRIIASLARRVEVGTGSSDELADRVVSHFDVDGLRPIEIDALREQDTIARKQICRAVVLGRTMRVLPQASDALESLNIDPTTLEVQGVEELMRAMSDTARVLFGESRYNEAFELSEVRTRNLMSLGLDTDAGSAREDRAAPQSAEEEAAPVVVASTSHQRLFSILLKPALGVALLAAFLLVVGTRERSSMSPEELAGISPFLESGQLIENAGERRFVGRIARTWDFVETADRRSIATEIGRHFDKQGIDTVVLLAEGTGDTSRELARWEDGTLEKLVSKRPTRTTPADGLLD